MRFLNEEKECLFCHKKFYPQIIKGGISKAKARKFCNPGCSNKHHSGTKSPHWKGGYYISTSGYIYNGKTTQLQHREVMEKHLGRKLKRNEAVHHKNHIKTDNRIENLEIIDIHEHGRIHSKEQLLCGWSVKHKECVECKTTKLKHKARGFCYRCYLRFQHARKTKEYKPRIYRRAIFRELTGAEKEQFRKEQALKQAFKN